MVGIDNVQYVFQEEPSFVLYWFDMTFTLLVPVAARSKAQVCGRSPAEIVGSVCCECCVLSGILVDLCDALITRPEESYRLRCVVVCDLVTSRMRRPWPALGRSATGVGRDLYFTLSSYQTRCPCGV